MGNSKRFRLLLVLLCMILFDVVAHAQRAPTPEESRRLLVEEDIISAGVKNPRVLDAIRNTPRHELVPIKQRKNAYYDMSLPIGDQQTISSPFIVAYMTESLDPQPTDRVLEIGTGSGYQAAVLSPLVKEVYTIEIVETLGLRAQRNLSRLGYDNVHVRVGDGFQGWSEHAPYNKIIVTCSPEDVPQPLMDQLAEGGKMVIPVGQRYQQVLFMYVKNDGKLEREPLRPTLFVPMTGQAERQRETQPDPSNPSIVNGSFEDRAVGQHEFNGWFYQRQLTRYQGEGIPDGNSCALFQNETPDRASHCLQGFAVDGRSVQQIRISAEVKVDRVKRGSKKEMTPAIVVSFYDAQRSPLGVQWLGPWTGSSHWRRVAKTVSVPHQAREAILRVGLFGATGTLYVDDVQISSAGRPGP
jgi:protein-L-isoaspartate(D-aspartate) O-methyltransferase